MTLVIGEWTVPGHFRPLFSGISNKPLQNVNLPQDPCRRYISRIFGFEEVAVGIILQKCGV